MSRVAIGNDVVDLDAPRTQGKWRDERFVARVLADPERRTLEGSADPDEAFWRHWAAKEAAYKLISKLQGAPPVFVHRDFVLDGAEIVYQGSRYLVQFSRHGSALHAVACVGADPEEALVGLARIDQAGTPWSAPLEDLLGRFTERERDPIHSHPSAAVRLGARAALSWALQVEESRLEIVSPPGTTGRRPPYVLLDGEAAPADVSLSHSDGWMAWAILLGEPPARPDGDA